MTAAKAENEALQAQLDDLMARHAQLSTAHGAAVAQAAEQSAALETAQQARQAAEASLKAATAKVQSIRLYFISLHQMLAAHLQSLLCLFCLQAAMLRCIFDRCSWQLMLAVVMHARGQVEALQGDLEAARARPEQDTTVPKLPQVGRSASDILQHPLWQPSSSGCSNDYSLHKARSTCHTLIPAGSPGVEPIIAKLPVSGFHQMLSSRVSRARATELDAVISSDLPARMENTSTLTMSARQAVACHPADGVATLMGLLPCCELSNDAMDAYSFIGGQM